MGAEMMKIQIILKMEERDLYQKINVSIVRKVATGT
jgi:hypothetical protein